MDIYVIAVNGTPCKWFQKKENALEVLKMMERIRTDTDYVEMFDVPQFSEKLEAMK